MDVVRHERGFSKAEKRFPRKDTCLAIYSHRVNTQRPLADTLALDVSVVRGMGRRADGAFPRVRRAQNPEPGARLRRPAALLARDDAGRRRSRRRSARASTTCWSTSTRTPTCCRRRSCSGSGPTGAGVTVVGDDAQAIYSFRAATVENIRGFAQQYQNRGQTTISLEENYRSTQQVLDAANALIGKQPLLEEEGRREAALRHGGRRRGAGAVRGDARARGARARRAAAQPGGAVPRLAPLRPARARARAAQHPVREVRRPQVPRGGARQGPARGAALGGQPEEPRRRVPRAAAPARRRTGDARRASSRASKPTGSWQALQDRIGASWTSCM